MATHTTPQHANGPSSSHSQASEVWKNDRFLKEAHILTLANEKDKHILVFQDKKKNKFNSEVDVVHYGPGWADPKILTRQEARWSLDQIRCSTHPLRLPTHTL